jgi:hypothetical protein
MWRENRRQWRNGGVMAKEAKAQLINGMEAIINESNEIFIEWRRK